MTPDLQQTGLERFTRIVVKANDRWISETDLVGLTEVRVQQRLSVPTLCELFFRDPPGPLETAANLTVGAKLWVGIKDHRIPLFVGDVTAVEYLYGPDNVQEIYVRGYDPLHRLRKRQTVRTFEEITLPGFVRQMAASVDLKVSMPDSELKWRRLYQHHQTDLELLTEIAAQDGLYLTVREDVLHLITLDGTGDRQTLVLGDTLEEAQIEMNADSAVDRVLAQGWDPARIESYEGQAKAARSGRQIRAELSAKSVGGGGERVLVNETTPRKEHAVALAQAELDQRKAGEVVLRGRASGSPALRPGTPVDVSGVNRLLNGQYILTEVDHTLDSESGYSSRISTAPPGILPRPRADVATYGLVTDTADPDKLGRIRARLPGYNNVETDWMPVLMPGAGQNKGIIALPDKDDLVLIILTRENPGQGIVLGGLYGPYPSPDVGTSAASVGRTVSRFSWLTPGGQRIQLNDSGNKIRLENDSGAFIELAGASIRIVGNSIDFSRIGIARTAANVAGDLTTAEATRRAELQQWIKKQSEQDKFLLYVALALVGVMALVIIGLIVAQSLG